MRALATPDSSGRMVGSEIVRLRVAAGASVPLGALESTLPLLFKKVQNATVTG